MDRILTTHTGSLTRPRALLDFLASRWSAASRSTQAAYEQAPRRRGRRRRRGARPRRGSTSSTTARWARPTWITYLYERVSGIEPRLVPLEGGDDPAAEPRPAGVPGVLRRARRRVRARGANQVRVQVAEEPDADAPTADEASTGSAPGRSSTTPSALAAGHRRLQGRARRRRGRRRVPARRRAGERLLAATTSTTRPRRSSSSRVADALHEEYKAIVDAGLPAPGRRRRAAARVRLDPLARRLGRGLPALGGAARRGAQPRARGHPRGPHPLPRLLRELARPARLRPAARRRDRPRPQGERRATT